MNQRLAPLKKREDRRDRTMRYGARARKIHLRTVHPNGAVDCVCEFSVWKFAKGKSLGCHCRKKIYGNPKIGTGICHNYDDLNNRQRIDSRRLCRAWNSSVNSGIDPLDVEF